MNAIIDHIHSAAESTCMHESCTSASRMPPARWPTTAAARLLRGGNFPLAYVYPPRVRATRNRITILQVNDQTSGSNPEPDQPVQPASAGDAVSTASPPG